MKGRILIGGTNSGSGKTTLTIGLLSALKKRGHSLSAFKCGPDYIDPMFHREVLGVSSGNLDSYFYSENLCRELFCENASDFSIIEGVMGYYDGGAGSTANLARILGAPTILVVNASGAFQSVLAVIHGFLTWEENNIAGVILNNTSQNVFTQLKGDIEKMGVKAVGFVPKLSKDLLLESRHLGLVTAGEIENLATKVDKLAEILQATIDIEAILEIGNSASKLEYKKTEIEKCESVKIAVAKDSAFCFCYRENISLLEKMGCEICYFSPLEDKKLPDCDGLYLVGGYPELYKKQLAENREMLADVKDKIQNGLPTIAECGGYMYLTDKIDGEKMCGVFPCECEKKEKLVRFGYLQMKKLENGGLFDGNFKGHEFHYYDSTNNGEAFSCTKQNGTSWKAGHLTESVYAGFGHLAFHSDKKSVEDFIRKCNEYKNIGGKDEK
ncbi:MAG: cobyrinate a,c-diamide synthase [Bacillota bacterium]